MKKDLYVYLQSVDYSGDYIGNEWSVQLCFDDRPSKEIHFCLGREQSIELDEPLLELSGDPALSPLGLKVRVREKDPKSDDIGEGETTIIIADGASSRVDVEVKGRGGEARRRARLQFTFVTGYEVPEGDSNREFFVSAIDTGHLTVICWNGLAKKSYLSGFDLYRVSPSLEGSTYEKLNENLLPLRGMFFDNSHHPFTVLEKDPVEKIYEAIERYEGTKNIVGGLDFAEGLLRLENSSYLLTFDDFRRLGTNFLPPGSYLLIGEYLTGERDGTYESKPKKREWTAEDKKRVQDNIDKCLRGIKRRKLVKKLLGKNIPYNTSMPHVTITGDCGEIGVAGKTWPSGRAVDGTNKAKSKITINGNMALDYSPEFLLALLIHEIVHAMQNYCGVPDLTEQALSQTIMFSVCQEIVAYGEIFKLIQSGDLQLTPTEVCAEIQTGMSAVLKEYDDAGEQIEKEVKSGKKPTEETERKMKEMRKKVRELLKKYKEFSNGQKEWEGIGKGGVKKPISDAIQDNINIIPGG